MQFTCSGYQIENEIGVACSTYGGGEVHTGNWWGNLREGDHLEEPGVDGRIILKLNLKKWDVGGMDQIELAQDRDRWRGLVNAVMNLWVPNNAGNFLTSRELVSFSRRTLLHVASICTVYTKHRCKQSKSDITKIPMEFTVSFTSSSAVHKPKT